MDSQRPPANTDEPRTLTVRIDSEAIEEMQRIQESAASALTGSLTSMKGWIDGADALHEAIGQVGDAYAGGVAPFADVFDEFQTIDGIPELGGLVRIQDELGPLLASQRAIMEDLAGSPAIEAANRGLALSSVFDELDGIGQNLTSIREAGQWSLIDVPSVDDWEWETPQQRTVEQLEQLVDVTRQMATDAAEERAEHREHLAEQDRRFEEQTKATRRRHRQETAVAIVGTAITTLGAVAAAASAGWL